jgi:hypothetical protein
MDMLSEAAGEKADPVFVGEFECDDGVGRLFFGEAKGALGGGRVAVGSLLGAMLEFERRDW